AVRRNNTDLARCLVDRGANVNGESELSWAPICLASVHGHLDMVQSLLERGADIHVHHGLGGMSALHAAAAAGHPDVVQLLLDSGSDPNDRLDGQWTALHLAA
ncbi:ankyrin repeat protein, partial [Schizophyllum commune]